MGCDDLYYLAIQSSYLDVQVAVYRNDLQLHKKSIKKIDASAQSILVIDDLLSVCSLRIDDITFIAVNLGPAPFTTLRVIIASANGIGFATNIPLIGVDGLRMLLCESYGSSNLITVALLDAFANDVYYGFKNFDNSMQTSCMPLALLLDKVKSTFHNQPVRFIGNGALLYHEIIQKKMGLQATIDESFSYCSIESVARFGLEQWSKQQPLPRQLVPLYLKRQWWQ